MSDKLDSSASVDEIGIPTTDTDELTLMASPGLEFKLLLFELEPLSCRLRAAALNSPHDNVLHPDVWPLLRKAFLIKRFLEQLKAEKLH